MTLQQDILILKGTIIDADEKRRYRIHENAYLISENGICQGIYQALPKQLPKRWLQY